MVINMPTDDPDNLKALQRHFDQGQDMIAAYRGALALIPPDAWSRICPTFGLASEPTTVGAGQGRDKVSGLIWDPGGPLGVRRGRAGPPRDGGT